MTARDYILAEARLPALSANPPQVAVLPWGATEAHGGHLPFGTDVYEATAFAERATELAVAEGARVVVLPTIPFGNDQQQLDQVCTISIRTETALAILGDVCRSLSRQGIDRLVILNGHGGNQFQPLVRDLSDEFGMLIVVANFYQMAPDALGVFDQPGDHADELETSLIMHLHPDLVRMDKAGKGERVPFAIEGLSQPGVWTPRPWARSHPDTGSGDPSQATADKGQRYFEAVANAMKNLLVGLANAKKGDLPYL